jgi:hypothetical protein
MPHPSADTLSALANLQVLRGCRFDDLAWPARDTDLDDLAAGRLIAHTMTYTSMTVATVSVTVGPAFRALARPIAGTAEAVRRPNAGRPLSAGRPTAALTH